MQNNNIEEIIKKLEEQVAFYNDIANNEELDQKVRSYHKWIGLGVGYALDTVRSGGKE